MPTVEPGKLITGLQNELEKWRRGYYVRPSGKISQKKKAAPPLEARKPGQKKDVGDDAARERRRDDGDVAERGKDAEEARAAQTRSTALPHTLTPIHRHLERGDFLLGFVDNDGSFTVL